MNETLDTEKLRLIFAAFDGFLRFGFGYDVKERRSHCIYLKVSSTACVTWTARSWITPLLAIRPFVFRTS